MLLLLACTPAVLNANPLSLLTYNVRGATSIRVER